MKLKKIASLMLAGIMAVSMLAACGEGKKDDTPSSSSTVAPAGYTATVYDLTTDTTKAVLKAGGSSYLDSVIKASAENLNAAAVINAVHNNWVVGADDISGIWAAVNRNLGGAAKDWRLAAVNQGVNLDMGGIVPVLAYAKGKTDIYILAIPTGPSDIAINTGVAAFVDAMMAGKNPSDPQTNYSYTLSASRELIGTADSGVYLVALAFSMSETSKA